jgi:hypothetical protein
MVSKGGVGLQDGMRLENRVLLEGGGGVLRWVMSVDSLSVCASRLLTRVATVNGAIAMMLCSCQLELRRKVGFGMC